MSAPIERPLKTRSALQKFDRLVDPDGLLSPEDRAYRAARARQAARAERTRKRAAGYRKGEL